QRHCDRWFSLGSEVKLPPALGGGLDIHIAPIGICGALRKDHNGRERRADTVFQEKFCTMDELLFVVVATLARSVQEEKHRIVTVGNIVLEIRNPVWQDISPVDELFGLEGRGILRKCYRGHKTTKNNQ